MLRIVGPAAVLAGDPESGRFVISSPQVAGSQVAVDTVVDARVPVPDLAADPSPLTVRLRERGIWTGFVNGDGSPSAFATGGVAVTTSPFHPIDRAGIPDTGLYVLGIPTEHTRYFMQGGSSRPQFWTDFVRGCRCHRRRRPERGHRERRRPEGRLSGRCRLRVRDRRAVRRRPPVEFSASRRRLEASRCGRLASGRRR